MCYCPCFFYSAFIKVYAAETPVVAPGQPVDLTYAAEKALPAVVTLSMYRTLRHKPLTFKTTHSVVSSIHSASLEILTKVMAHAVSRYRPLRRRLLVVVLSSLLMVIS